MRPNPWIIYDTKSRTKDFREPGRKTVTNDVRKRGTRRARSFKAARFNWDIQKEFTEKLLTAGKLFSRQPHFSTPSSHCHVHARSLHAPYSVPLPSLLPCTPAAFLFPTHLAQTCLWPSSPAPASFALVDLPGRCFPTRAIYLSAVR